MTAGLPETEAKSGARNQRRSSKQAEASTSGAGEEEEDQYLLAKSYFDMKVRPGPYFNIMQAFSTARHQPLCCQCQQYQ